MVQQPYQTPWSQATDETADLLDLVYTGIRTADAILAMSPDRGAAAYEMLKQRTNEVLERLGPAPSATISVPELPRGAY